MMNGFGMGGMGFAWIFWILLIAGVVLLAVVLVKAFARNVGRGGPSGEQGLPRTGGPARAREILEERYARGEISTEEYQERRRTLEEDGR